MSPINSEKSQKKLVSRSGTFFSNSSRFTGDILFYLHISGKLVQNNIFFPNKRIFNLK